MYPDTREKIIDATDRIFNQNEFDYIDEIYADDMVMHLIPEGRDYEGREAFKQWRRDHHEAFPDFEVEHEDVIIGDEKFVTQWTARATHEGPLPGMGTPATNKTVEYRGTTIHRMGEEKLIEGWWYFDLFGILMQLGLIPE